MEIALKKLVQNKAQRRGRGIGSGRGGHTVGYGQKGQGSRGAHKVKNTDEGGQTPLYRKLPQQQGFRSLQPVIATVTVRWLNSHTEENTVVDNAFLIDHKVLMKVTDQAKVVGKDNVAHKITLKGIKCSAGAKSAIEKAGGSVID